MHVTPHSPHDYSASLWFSPNGVLIAFSSIVEPKLSYYPQIFSVSSSLSALMVFIVILETYQSIGVWTRCTGGHYRYTVSAVTSARDTWGKEGHFCCSVSPVLLISARIWAAWFCLLWLLRANTSSYLAPTRYQMIVFSFSMKVKLWVFPVITDWNSSWKAPTANWPSSVNPAI